jgi:GNAT superfamily N-acetyltransferase
MEKQNVIIRKAVSDDAEAIRDFQLACAKETEQKTLHPHIVEKGVLYVLSLMCTPASVGEYVVAVNEEDEVIGCCLLQIQFSDWNCGFYLNVESVYVHPDYRGIGVLQSLYRYAEQFALRGGQTCELRSTVSTENKAMQAGIQKVQMEKTVYQVYSKSSQKFVYQPPQVSNKQTWSRRTRYN